MGDDTSAEGIADIEDTTGTQSNISKTPVISVAQKRKRENDSYVTNQDLSKSWRDVLGSPPPFGTTKVLKFV